MEMRNAQGLTEREFLEQYNAGDYERPSVTVDMLVFGMSQKLDSLKLLLIKRKDHPYIGCWALAGGFVGINESGYQAACRELEEETGLKDIYLEQLYTMTQPSRDPRMRVIDIAYMALIPVVEVHAGDDAEDAVWFDVSLKGSTLSLSNKEKSVHIRYDLEETVFRNGRISVRGSVPLLKSRERLAFDHADILVEGLMRLRNKLEYSDIAFNLLADEFTLPDLQRVYEIILDKELYKTNFKGKLIGKVDAVGRQGKSIVGGRKSALYRYRGCGNDGSSVNKSTANSFWTFGGN